MPKRPADAFHMGNFAIAVGIFVLVSVILYVSNATMTRRHNASSGNHADFVGVAEIVPQRVGEQSIPGKLVINAGGFSFTASPKWNHVRGVISSPPLYERQIGWSEVSRTDLRPVPNKPLPGFVDLTLADGTSVTFRVNLYSKVCQALANSGHLHAS